MKSDADNYTPPAVPEGYVEAVNAEGETVWRLAELETRHQARQHWQREAFTLLKLRGLSTVLEISPRVNVAALVILIFAVQRDRVGGQALAINQDLVAKTGSNRKFLYRGVDWLEVHLGDLVTVTRKPGQAHRIKLTKAGRRAFHPSKPSQGGGRIWDR
jgi:hypothetical protein